MPKRRRRYHAGFGWAKDPTANFFQARFEFLGEGVDSRELREVVCECIGSASSEHSSLTESPTEELSEVTSSVDERLCADETRSDWCT